MFTVCFDAILIWHRSSISKVQSRVVSGKEITKTTPLTMEPEEKGHGVPVVRLWKAPLKSRAMCAWAGKAVRSLTVSAILSRPRLGLSLG